MSVLGDTKHGIVALNRNEDPHANSHCASDRRSSRMGQQELSSSEFPLTVRRLILARCCARNSSSRWASLSVNSRFGGEDRHQSIRRVSW
jgi:hypothetical protein